MFLELHPVFEQQWPQESTICTSLSFNYPSNEHNKERMGVHSFPRTLSKMMLHCKSRISPPVGFDKGWFGAQYRESIEVQRPCKPTRDAHKALPHFGNALCCSYSGRWVWEHELLRTWKTWRWLYASQTNGGGDDGDCNGEKLHEVEPCANIGYQDR